MAVNIGPKIGIDGEAQYRKELNSIIQQAKTLASEMKAVTSAFDKNDNSQAKLAAQTRVLTQQIEVQQRRVEQLQKGLDAAAKKYGETDSRTLKWKQAVNDATAELNRMQVELKQTTNETDDLGDELESAGRQVSSLGDIIKGSFLGNLMADAVSNIVSELGNLVSEGAKAADALTKFRSTMDFAGYDAGTIEETADAMQDYASRTVYDLQTVANTTAQLAANSVPDFEALTEAAGNLNAVAGGNADTFKSVSMVLTQTAGAGKLTTENWNQLADAIPGASGVLQQAMLENGAYVGNFREAMENGEISAEEFNSAIMQLGSSDEAVKAAQSVSTIEGAVGNLQATFTDFIASLLTDAGGMSMITSGINSLSQGFQDLFSHIDTSSLSAAFSSFLAYLPTLVPQMVAQGVSLLQALGQGIVSAVPQLFQAAVGVVQGLTAYLAENLPQLVSSGLQSLLSFSQGLNEGVGNLVDSAIEMIMTLADGLISSLPVLIETVPTIVSNIANTINENAPKLLMAAAELIKKLAVGLVSNIPVLISNLPQIIMAIADTITAFNWLNLGSQIIKAIGNGLASAAGFLGEMGSKTIRQLIETIKSAVSQLPKLALQWGKDMITGFVKGITSSVGSIINAVKNIGSAIASYLHFSRPDEGPLRQYESWMPDFMKGMARGIEENAWRIDDALAGVSNMMVFRPQAYAAQPAAAAAGTGSVYAGQPISITVNAAPGQDENYIAELVMQKIQAATARKEATWGR